VSSNAFSDYAIRKAKVDYVQSNALTSLDPEHASLYAECAAVLACAALERYLNDVLEEYCAAFNETSWGDLSPGRQRYLLRHVALRMQQKSGSFTAISQPSPSECAGLMRFAKECCDALNNPSTWRHFSDFGIFGEGSSSPDKIVSILRAFDSEGRNITTYIDDVGHDYRAVMQSLAQLVDTRHATAHAIKGSSPPSPSDTGIWIDASFALVGAIDAFLGFVPQDKPIEQPTAAGGGDEHSDHGTHQA